MKKLFIPLVLSGIIFTSCSKEGIEEIEEVKEIEKVELRDVSVDLFIHKALADWYLYEAEVPQLQEEFFESAQDKKEYFASLDSPEESFNKLLASHDKFSFMWDDYEELEKLLYSGTEKTTGVIYAWGGLGLGDDVFVITRYVLPNSSAEQASIKRGDIFMEVNGVQLTKWNSRELLSQDNLTVSYAEMKDNSIVLTGEKAKLSAVEMAENPVHIAKVIKMGGLRIGYLMYNGFTYDFDPQLNEAFGYFRSENIDELVVDLRYNGGGNVETASDLASMITGAYEGKIFAQLMFNEKWANIYGKEAPELVNFRFNNEIHTGEQINSLNLAKVYVIATFDSASASELLINALEPYIDVIHIGTRTAGKYQSSRTLYDSSEWNFSKKNVNPNHKYVIQPLISKMTNSVGRSDYSEGLVPDLQIYERLRYAPLGDPNEPMLKLALNAIVFNPQGNQARATTKQMEVNGFEIEGNSKMFQPTYQRMYTNEIPLLK